MNNPTFWSVVITFLTVLTSLIKQFMLDRKVSKTASKVDEIHENTAGPTGDMQRALQVANALRATPEELAARNTAASTNTPH